MDILKKIKHHKDTATYFWAKRQVAAEAYVKIHGFVVDHSKDFICLHEVDDFELNGYCIFPISTIAEIRYKNSDRFYNKILHAEGIAKNAMRKHNVDLTSWTSIFASLKKLKLHVIVENEDPDNEFFDIGPITNVTKSSVSIRYFNPQGYFDSVPTKRKFSSITIVTFDERYVNTMSKYVRERKTNK